MLLACGLKYAKQLSAHSVPVGGNYRVQLVVNQVESAREKSTAKYQQFGSVMNSQIEAAAKIKTDRIKNHHPKAASFAPASIAMPVPSGLQRKLMYQKRALGVQ